jgi:hypothetical protein
LVCFPSGQKQQQRCKTIRTTLITAKSVALDGRGRGKDEAPVESISFILNLHLNKKIISLIQKESFHLHES